MKISVGDFREFGARVVDGNIIITYSASAKAKNISIIIYDGATNKKISTIRLTEEYAIGRVYSICIEGLNAKDIYYLIEEDGRRLLDPYSTLVKKRDKWADVDGRKKQKFKVGSGVAQINKPWKDYPVSIKPMDMVIYKLHMRGFTAGFSMAESKVGNYKGVLGKLSYLKSLGVNTIEVMPLYDFEELFIEERQVINAKGELHNTVEYLDKVNYWGYGKAAYFAPKASYFRGAENACAGLRDFVGTIHKNGMELIMEFSFDENVSEDYIVNCLCYYVRYYHIDGFHIMGCNVPIKRIANEPFLASTKIFCEYIPEDILTSECGKKHLFIYNDSFMNVTRQIQNHMNGSMVQYANHMRRQNKAYGFVNYMSSVCGFSLMDSYSYGEKHNLDNGEDNRDGTNSNFSFNYGVEGATKNKAINEKRFLEMRNAFACVMLSQSIPLIVAGDEVAASHEGNNNPYCQDNKIGYTVFSKSKQKNTLKQFVSELAEFRRKHACIRPENAFSMNDTLHKGFPDMSFHGSEPWTMFIGEEQKSLGVLYSGMYAAEKEDVYVCYNFHYDSVEMALPHLEPGKRWRQVFNTSEYNENSSFTPKPIHDQQSISVKGSSITVLVGVKP